jgi:hypothetical protein
MLFKNKSILTKNFFIFYQLINKEKEDKNKIINNKI